MSKTRLALWVTLALALVTRPLDILLGAMLPDVSVNPLPQCLAGMLASLLLLGLPAWLMRPWTSIRLTRAKSLWPGLLMAVGGALLLRGALSPVDTAWQRWLEIAPNPLPAPANLPTALLYVLALTAIPALAEEAFFRGALLTSLLDGSRRAAAVALTTVIFALMHTSAANLPSLLAVSLFLTLLMLRTGCIAVLKTAHLVYNLTALGGIALPGWGSMLCGAGLAGILMMLCVRRQKIVHQPMNRGDGWIAALTLAVLTALKFV